LRRIVGTVGLQEHDRAGAAGGGLAGAGEAGIAVTPTRLSEDLSARGTDDLRATVGRPVVDEERLAEQAEVRELREQRGQRLRLVEDGDDDKEIGAGLRGRGSALGLGGVGR
jgi:hypothetical protein